MWTHDGSRVAAISYVENSIRILDMKSGKMTTGAKSGSTPKAAIVSPDNSRLAIDSGVHGSRRSFTSRC